MADNDKALGRLRTGIDGLDNITSGGVPLNNQVLIAGGPGCGKTLLSMQIAYNSAKNGIPASFITLEETQAEVLENFKTAFSEFNDIDDLVSKKMLVLAGDETASKIQGGNDSQSYAFSSVLSDIEDILKINGSKCVVIDSISLLKLMLGDLLTYRKSMFALSTNMKRMGVTGFLTMELHSTNRQGMSFSPEFFIFDGTLIMYQNIEENKRVYGMEVLKMRGSDHSLSVAPYEITKRGFKVFTISDI
ncbi:MAG: hypothetical protein M1528_01365 [Candidatus Marsarchaeota archaeon]|jgi:circadian clock protein KaiC|nr:hypothetical protein [Candidatus Marsarchaeota archaeon]MCL5115166.1 hypothetical protein [Candidatus Marsarchaeota archaeon]